MTSRGQQTCTHRSRPRLWDWMVVCVPLLCLSVDFAVSPVERLFHLIHSEGTHCRTSRGTLVPEKNRCFKTKECLKPQRNLFLTLQRRCLVSIFLIKIKMIQNAIIIFKDSAEECHFQWDF